MLFSHLNIARVFAKVWNRLVRFSVDFASCHLSVFGRKPVSLVFTLGFYTLLLRITSACRAILICVFLFTLLQFACWLITQAFDFLMPEKSMKRSDFRYRSLPITARNVSLFTFFETAMVHVLSREFKHHVCFQSRERQKKNPTFAVCRFYVKVSSFAFGVNVWIIFDFSDGFI